MPRRVAEEFDGKSARQLIAALFKTRMLMTVFKRARKCDTIHIYIHCIVKIHSFIPTFLNTDALSQQSQHSNNHRLSGFIYRYPTTQSFIPEKSITKEKLFSSAAVSNTNEHIKLRAKTPQHPVISPPL
jgi:hypothetical protein